ncbi:MAG: prephenate dehydrogenase [Longimicrobiales bacterium]|nr:prephenate dehydrogenase [Longimicrobiales bacterium]
MKITVLGLGVMGGSIARSLAAAPDDEVTGWSPDPEERDAAVRVGIPTETTPVAAVADAHLVVFAIPLGAIRARASEVAEALRADALVTDLASLQSPVLKWAEEVGLAERWITAHPLTGSERVGFEASRQGLYTDARVYLSASEVAPKRAREEVRDAWRRAGATPEWIDPAEHDRRMARVSHLPQVVATALGDALAHLGIHPDELGPGGRDTTRLAASSPAMWGDLFAHADPGLGDALREVARRLEADADALERGEVASLVERLERTGAWRRSR